jgi:hypothetical protein
LRTVEGGTAGFPSSFPPGEARAEEEVCSRDRGRTRGGAVLVWIPRELFFFAKKSARALPQVQALDSRDGRWRANREPGPAEMDVVC